MSEQKDTYKLTDAQISEMISRGPTVSPAQFHDIVPIKSVTGIPVSMIRNPRADCNYGDK